MNTILDRTKRKEQNAFTLVELLTVVVIISMLAGMSMLVLSGTMTAAKESKTRGTIAKLDAAIRDIYEGYQQRFEEINITDSVLETALVIPPGTLTDQQRALAKLHFISDIMRMEMPYQWKEVVHKATPGTGPGYVTVFDPDNGAPTSISATSGGEIPIGSYYLAGSPANPPVLQYYRRAYASIRTLNQTDQQSSELLFLIIANLNPEALENFHGSEIGDINGNGLHEFHDAWGNPIQFIRWAPAFTGSDLQPDVVVTPSYQYPYDETNGGTKNWINSVVVPPANWNASSPSLTSNMVLANGNYSDPFDPGGHINRTWFVYPLIVSGGADGSVDLAFDYPLPPPAPPDSLPSTVSSPTVILHPTRFPWGLPADTDKNGVLNHYDNIHNHRSSGNSF